MDSATSVLMNEDALARLEAGLRAQREWLIRERLQPSPELGPADNEDAPQMPDTLCLQPPPQGPIDIPHFLMRDMKKASA